MQKLPPIAPVRSGIEMLRGQSDERSIDWSNVLNGLYADELTWCRWQGVTRLKAFEALALHHHLDPDRLNLGCADPGVRDRLLMRFGRAGSGGPLERFNVQLMWLATHVEQGKLECLEVDPADPLASITTPEYFARYLAGAPRLPRAVVTQGRAVNSPRRIRHSTQLLRELEAARRLYATVAEGGTYVEGDLSTAPDVQAFLRATGRVSEKMVGALATILRPENLPKGRPPKRRSK